MDKRIVAAKIKFPKHWKEDYIVEQILNLPEEDLYEDFGCGNKAAFTRLMNPCFPERPARVSFRKYLQEVLNGPMPETFSELQERKKREREYEQINT